MMLIKCFTQSHIDNIAACLRLYPDKMVMVGNAEEMSVPIQRYRKLCKQRGLSTDITMCDVRGKDIGDICAVLEQLVRGKAECVIDLTGGDELVIMAVGAVLSRLDGSQRQQVRVEIFDHDTGAVLDCVNDNRKLPCEKVDLTVEELIALHGGSLHPDAYQPPVDCGAKDLDGLWNLVSNAPRDWNRAIMLLAEVESRADSKMQVCLPREYLRGSIPNYHEKESVVCDLLDKLNHAKIIQNHSSQSALEYTYRSSLLRYCTLKAGNVLEVKTLLEGRSILETGVPLFHDCRMSVSIDWDGVVHDPAERIPETRNEIDVVMMHGMTPLFISCKNGNIDEDELYKLHTVATRFGGPNARKMLIATNLERKSPAANRAFMQRAWDMDIFLVTDAAELSKEEWKQLFYQAIK